MFLRKNDTMQIYKQDFAGVICVTKQNESIWKHRKLFCLVVCCLLLVAVVFAVHTKNAESLLSGKDVAGVSFLYNSIEDPTSGVCPQIEVGQSEMDEVNGFLQDLNIRWCGVYGNGSGMDVPAYHLFFFDESGMPQVEMYITSTGNLYSGHMAYRIITPSSKEAWLQLGGLYELACNM